MKLSSILTTIIGSMFPVSCYGCGVPKTALCAACVATIPLAPPTDSPHMFGIYDYNNTIVRRAIWELKFKRKSELARALATYGAVHVHDSIAEVCIGSVSRVHIVPIPQHSSKAREKGFNQSMVIGNSIATQIPTATLSLVLHKNPIN